MSLAAARISEFHEAFGVPEGELSVVKLARRRRTLHREEAVEVSGALAEIGNCGCAECHADLPEKLEHLAEELADDVIVAYGTADLLGIDLDEAFAIKMNANMAKLPRCEYCGGDGDSGKVLVKAGKQSRIPCPACGGSGKGPPLKRPDGKILKPEGWQKPSMAEAIR